MRSARSKACGISPKVRQEVLERDDHRCIICGWHDCLQIAHLIPRSLGGLGIKENLVTMCVVCHNKSHNEAPYLEEQMRAYLEFHYPDFTDKERRYSKWH